MEKFYVKESIKSSISFSNPSIISKQFKELAYADQESLWVLGLNNHNKALIKECVYKGTVDQCSADGRLIFKRLLCAGASNFIIIHSHPAGCCKPSEDDRKNHSKNKRRG